MRKDVSNDMTTTNERKSKFLFSFITVECQKSRMFFLMVYHYFLYNRTFNSKRSHFLFLVISLAM